jgi:hypothetical protein
MQHRSWSHFRNAVELIQGGALGTVPQVRTYWWQNYGSSWVPEPVDQSQLDWKRWLGGKGDRNPVLKEKSFEDGTIAHTRNFFECIKSRKDPNALVEAGVAAARAGHIGNYAFHHGGKTAWPLKE